MPSPQVAIALALLGALAAAPAAQAATQNFGYTGGEQTFTVPDGVTTIQVVAVGASGGKGSDDTPNIGGSGGFGARLDTDLAITPGEVLFVEVGGTGRSGADAGAGGFNGGGSSAISGFDTAGGGGGGATDIRTCSRVAATCADALDTLTSRLLVAGGGGGGGDEGRLLQPTEGAGGNADHDGNDGAATTCSTGTTQGGGGRAGTTSAGGLGGTAGQGGAPAGNAGLFGQGGAAGSGGENSQVGGGGGGGYFGGGAGGSANGCDAGGGGGGASFFALSASNTTVSADTIGVPSVTITYTSRGGGTPGGGNTPGARAAITHLRISPSIFVAASSGDSIARAGRGTGATVAYSDSRPATTTLTVLRATPGAQRGTHCRKPRRGATGRHCTRYVKVGSFRHGDRAGAASFHFTGRVRHHKLRPGRYLLRVVPGFGGRTGGAATKHFRIIRGASS
jgi:hypothetical protein